MAHRIVHIRQCMGVLALVACFSGAPAGALTDWRRDGRPGYPERDMAEALARAFTAAGAPRAGQAWRIVRDPDGGFTPVFEELSPVNGPTS